MVSQRKIDANFEKQNFSDVQDTEIISVHIDELSKYYGSCKEKYEAYEAIGMHLPP